jgi:TonB family protein
MRRLTPLALLLLLPASLARAQGDAAEISITIRSAEGLDRAALRERLEALEEAAARCVPEGATAPWQLRLTVAADGDVIAVADEGPRRQTPDARRTARCLGRLFAAARLPAPTAGGAARVDLWVGRMLHRRHVGVLGLLQEGGGTGPRLGSSGGGVLRGRGLGVGGGSSPGSSGGSRPQVTPGDRPNVSGSLSRELVQRIIRRHRAQVRYCYERRLAEDPDLAGRVTLRIQIGPDGAVRAARIGGSTLGDAEVERCITRMARRWRFPPPRGGGSVQVSYPFLFRNGAGAPAPDDRPERSAPPSDRPDAPASGGDR